MSTAALVVSAKSITTAIERLDVLLASRSDPDDQTLRALRDKIAAVRGAASVGQTDSNLAATVRRPPKSGRPRKDPVSSYGRFRRRADT